MKASVRSSAIAESEDIFSGCDDPDDEMSHTIDPITAAAIVNRMRQVSASGTVRPIRGQ